MKIWYWSYHDDDSGSGVVQVWGASQREVRVALWKAKADGVKSFHPFATPQRLDVPTDKQGLIRFLTKYGSNG